MSEQRESAQPCGCDPGMGHFCAYHDPDTLTQQGVWKNPKDPFKGLPRPVPSPDTFIDVALGPYPATGTGGSTGCTVRTPRPPGFSLPTDPKERKKYPLTTGVLDYFPDALLAVARVSYEGNQQHNPGEPLHWARGKSMDQADTVNRHLIQRGTRDTDGMRHTAKAAWRILAMLQLEIEADIDVEGK